MAAGTGSRPTGRRAVVVGGSFAGMLAAAALASSVDEVTVVERYALPDGPDPRQGVPQGRHAHLLWSGGARAAEELLPGLTARLLGAGARRIAVPADLLMLTSGGWLTRFPEHQFFLSCSRDLLDWVVRDMTAALPSVRTLPGTSALGLRGTRTRVTGVVVGDPDGGERELAADLVVDASGRSSAAPKWLEALGLPRVRTQIVDSGLGYASRIFRAPAGTDGFPAVNIQADPRRRVPGLNGTILPNEGGRWIVTLSGTRGGQPTADAGAFEAFARGLRHPVIGELIALAEPLTDVAVTHSTVNQRRLYEKMAVWPEGLVVIGDALASYNPLYGQGMSVAAHHARALRRHVRGQPGAGLGRRVQHAAAAAVTAAWALSSGQDLRYPEVKGEPPGPAAAVMNRYTDRLMRTATLRHTVACALFDVMSLSSSQNTLVRPDVMASALSPFRTAPAPNPPFTAAELAALPGPRKPDEE